MFRIKTGYYVERLTPETIKLLLNTKSNITKDENAENRPHVEITELVLVHCNIVNNSYQHDSRILYRFVSKSSFCKLLDISPKKFNSESLYIEVWFTDKEF